MWGNKRLGSAESIAKTSIEQISSVNGDIINAASPESLIQLWLDLLIHTRQSLTDSNASL